jgi:S1-C subfamily serine protease
MRQSRWPLPVLQQPQPEPKQPASRFTTLRVLLNSLFTRYHGLFLIAAVVIVALGSVFIYDMMRPPPQHLTQRDIDAAVGRSLATTTPKPSFASQAYEIIVPSVVQVEATFLSTEGASESSIGTGVVVDDSGTILTCLHIVTDATSVRVTFSDGTQSEASVVVTQAENDLAVLRPQVIPDDVVPATLTSSDTLHVGDEVFAVGNPFSITDSLSAGVVSGLGRSFKFPESGQILINLIQFDAAVNPGNSGGPLVDRNGEVVGIITALLNPTDQDFFIGIGFAITIETAAGAAGAPPV